MKAKQVKKTVAGICLSVALISPVNMITFPILAHASASSAVTSQQESLNLSNAQKADAIVAFAESLIGKVSYKWGVNDPKDLIFDCSSFTKYVYSTQGINLKWGAAKQATQGVHVDKANLQKGDLVHFSLGTPGKIEHVGIYIGDGKFIQNLKPGVNVEISDLNSKYWRNHYITATRILNGDSTAQAAAIPAATSTDTGKTVPSSSAAISSDKADSYDEDFVKPVNKIYAVVEKFMEFLLSLFTAPLT